MQIGLDLFQKYPYMGTGKKEGKPHMSIAAPQHDAGNSLAPMRPVLLHFRCKCSWRCSAT
jgi:hypothetical protein